jgi:DNA-binding MarR family transcriptional regulator
MKEDSILSKLRTIKIELSKKISSNFDSQEDKLGRSSGMIIVFLCHNQDRDIYAKDIERFLNIRRSTCATILKNLEEKEYIKRISVESDARIKKIVLLEKGKSKLENIKKIHDSVEEQIFNSLEKEEQTELLKLLDKLIVSLKGEKNV